MTTTLEETEETKETEGTQVAPAVHDDADEWKPALVLLSPNARGEVIAKLGGQVRTFHWPTDETSPPAPPRKVPVFGFWDPMVPEEIMIFAGSWKAPAATVQQCDHPFLGVARSAE